MLTRREFIGSAAAVAAAAAQTPQQPLRIAVVTTIYRYLSHGQHIGDRFLVCSDGVTGVLDDDEIQEVLADVPEPADAVDRIIELANDGGGPDNITCVVADVIEDDGRGALIDPVVDGAAYLASLLRSAALWWSLAAPFRFPGSARRGLSCALRVGRLVLP